MRNVECAHDLHTSVRALACKPSRWISLANWMSYSAMKSLGNTDDIAGQSLAAGIGL
jgi:hypothetical protein